jgi:BCD family chlorophyll transporter-like MFS transporter
LGRAIFQVPLLAYSTVFTVQAIGMILAIGLLNRVNIAEFNATAKQAIAKVLEQEFD